MRFIRKFFGKKRASVLPDSMQGAKAAADSAFLQQLRDDVTAAENRLFEQMLERCRSLPEACSERQPILEELKRLGQGLSPKLLTTLGYELARHGDDLHHRYGSGSDPFPRPISFLTHAWVFPHGGVAFVIHRDSFMGRTPRLFFAADDIPCPYKPTEEVAADILNASSQIRDLSFQPKEDGGSPSCRIEFTLDKPEFGRRIRLLGSDIPCELLPGPVIQIPLIGEFNCSMGEVTPEGDVTLYRDNFCLK